jgi:hypothetical protein
VIGPVPYKLRMAFSAIVRSALGALAGVALLTAACGGEGSHTPAGSASGGAGMAKLQQYAQCMRSHGISDFPDPQPNPGGQGGSFQTSGGPGSDLDHNGPRYQAADQACKSLLPQQPVASAAHVAALVRLAACMRTHGYPNFPDPDSTGAFDSSKFDPRSPQLDSVMQACERQTGVTGPIGVHPGNGN